MKKQLWTGLGASIGMLILILDGKTALEGAREGVDLCIWTVIPSLFPFFVLSILLTGAFMGSQLSHIRLFGKLFSLPEATESLLIPAFLGGYPAGAQSIAQAFHQRQLSKETAEQLLAYCNNAGPAFLFGMTAVHFPQKGMVWLLWLIHICSAILVSIVLPCGNTKGNVTGGKVISFSDAVLSALKVMAQVCGWLVLFRVIIRFLNRWILWIFPIELQVAVTGLLELSNGCCMLNKIPDVRLRFLICSGMLAFGGLCVTMQTLSVTTGLSLKRFFLGKVLQTLFSLLLCAGILWNPICVLPLFIIFLPRKMRNNSRNPTTVGV